jgi:hypothetical protein
LWVIFAVLDPVPDPDSESASTDLIESVSETLGPVQQQKVNFLRSSYLSSNITEYGEMATVPGNSKPGVGLKSLAGALVVYYKCLPE